ncbi:TldD/PmbA family protein [uncultured Traorella sp.]|uniref:TldD/PmbA family protein n=1 Tax=uncultured Traorella sp. TaxID=1929048 RepID=UPI0025DD76CC|nr:TldD/PmbA family protein [uncultured Traorella sp.]
MNTQKLIEKARSAGIETIEIYIQKAEKESINVYEQKVDSFTIAQSGGLAIRGLYQGKMGYCFLEEDSDDNIDLCIEMIKSNAQAIESEDSAMIYQGDKNYPEIEKSVSHMSETSVTDKINFLKEVEEKLLNADERISQVMETMMESEKAETRIVNSLGMDISKSDEVCVFYANVLANEENDHKSAYEIRVLRDIEHYDVDAFVADLKNKVLSKLNAVQVKSGKYKVILKNEAMCSLLGALCGLFNGENVYKGISQLKDKCGEMIFDEKITIKDDPLKKDGLSSSPFDDEGVACFTKTIVDHGRLKMFLHNQKSAAMMKCESTGNGFKSGYASSVGISPTNFYIENGENSFDELLAIMKDGLVIDELNGLHAGLNPISTDFSLQASGYLVENGKITRPVNLFTVAGNFLSMMKEVEAVGNDTYDSLSGISSPSLLLNELSISGE